MVLHTVRSIAVEIDENVYKKIKELEAKGESIGNVLSEIKLESENNCTLFDYCEDVIDTDCQGESLEYNDPILDETPFTKDWYDIED